MSEAAYPALIVSSLRVSREEGLPFDRAWARALREYPPPDAVSSNQTHRVLYGWRPILPFMKAHMRAGYESARAPRRTLPVRSRRA